MLIYSEFFEKNPKQDVSSVLQIKFAIEDSTQIQVLELNLFRNQLVTTRCDLA